MKRANKLGKYGVMYVSGTQNLTVLLLVIKPKALQIFTYFVFVVDFYSLNLN